MNAIRAIVRNGRIETQEPIDLPDGAIVTITPAVDDNRPDTPEAIAADLAAMSAFEPVVLTEDEQAAWEAERQACKAWEKAHFLEYAEQLRRLADAEVPPR